MKVLWPTSICLTLTISTVILPGLAATPTKPGSPCAKVGLQQTYKDKKYTCVKAGKKQWEKGTLAVKIISSPNSSLSNSISKLRTYAVQMEKTYLPKALATG